VPTMQCHAGPYEESNSCKTRMFLSEPFKHGPKNVQKQGNEMRLIHCVIISMNLVNCTRQKG